jgi:hypothetical protein
MSDTTPSSEATALSPAEKAKLAAAKKAEAAKKAAPVSKPYVDNGDGTITDPNMAGYKKVLYLGRPWSICGLGQRK